MKSETIKSSDGMKEFFKKRQPGDIDLVAITAEHIKVKLTEEHAKAFLSDPMIISVKELASGPQRIIINRYLTQILLRFKSRKPSVNINDTLMYLFNDGFLEDWVKIFKEIILPFIKRNKVYEVLDLVEDNSKKDK